MSVTGVSDRPPGFRSPSSFFFPPFTGQAYQGSVMPGVLSTITVTGTFLNLAGTPSSGTVTFTPTGAPLKDAASSLFTGGPVTVALNGSGSFSVRVVCTDNGDLAPPDWTYTITTNIDGVLTSYAGKAIPYSPGSAIDLSDLLP